MAGPPQPQHDTTNGTHVAGEPNGTGPSVDELAGMITGVNPSGRETSIGAEPQSIVQLAKTLIPNIKLHRQGDGNTHQPA